MRNKAVFFIMFFYSVLVCVHRYRQFFHLLLLQSIRMWFSSSEVWHKHCMTSLLLPCYEENDTVKNPRVLRFVECFSALFVDS